MSLRISASQLKAYRRCTRIIGHRYVDKIKEPTSIKQQFGKDVHTHLEHWLKKAVVPDSTPAGETAKQGLIHLPAPNPEYLVEQEFEFEIDPGINAYGFIDCVCPPIVTEKGPADFPIVIDHKSTGDLKWAMTMEQLAVDPQAIIYALWAMLTFQVSLVFVDWVYYSATNPKSGNRKPNGTKKVSWHFEAGDPYFQAEVTHIVEDMRVITNIRNTKTTGLALPLNTTGCGQYGGCFYENICQLSPMNQLTGAIANHQRSLTFGKKGN